MSSSESRRRRSTSRFCTAPSRPRIGASDSTASQLSCAHSRVATRCQADERRVEVAGILHPEVGQARPDPGLVDDPVAAMAARQLDVRLQRRLDEARIGVRPAHTGQHADEAPRDEAEPPRPAGDLRQLPRVEIAALLPVELRRLREQQRLAGQIDAVTEHVGGDADVRLPRDEPVDLLTP